MIMNNTLAIRTVLVPEPRTRQLLSVLAAPAPPPPTQALIPRLSSALAPAPALQPQIQPLQLKEQEVSVQHETAGPIDLTLPFGWQQRRVNAATFKALAGRPSDNLF